MCPESYKEINSWSHDQRFRMNNHSKLVKEIGKELNTKHKLDPRNFIGEYQLETGYKIDNSEFYWTIENISKFYDYLKNHQNFHGSFLSTTEQMNKHLLKKMSYVANIYYISKKWPKKRIAKIWTSQFAKHVHMYFNEARQPFKNTDLINKKNVIPTRYIGVSADDFLAPWIMLQKGSDWRCFERKLKGKTGTIVIFI